MEALYTSFMPPRRPRIPTPLEEPLDDRLARLDKDELVTLVAELAARDPRVRQTVDRTLDRPTGPDLPYYRRWFVSALGRRRWIPRREAAAWVHEVNAAISGIESLLRANQASDVITLTEYALRRLEKRILSLDDSDGLTRDFFWRLEAIHLAACLAASPPPVALAKRLFDWELDGDWDTFLGKIGSYAPALGPTGLRAYRRLADEAWDALPPPSNETFQHDYRRRRLATMRQAFARQSGDPVQIVTAHHEELTNPHQFCLMLQSLDEIGANDEIAEWGEMALAEYPDAGGSRVRSWMAAWHARHERSDEAIALLWLNVSLNRTAEAYLALMTLANTMQVWDNWRPKAIAALRPRVNENIAQLVAALLGEGDATLAWHEATHGTCPEWSLLEAARARAVSHPAETVDAYWKLVDWLLTPTGRSHYRRGIGLVHEVHEVMERAGELAEFPERVATLRRMHKLRPTLITMLDIEGW